MTASRAAWTVLVPFVTLLAILAVVVMVRENIGTDEAGGTSAYPRAVQKI